MSSADIPKYGTGEFPPPRCFERTPYQYASYQYASTQAIQPDMSRFNRENYAGRIKHESDPQITPVKTVGLLCCVALCALLLGIALWVVESFGGIVAEAGSKINFTSASIEQPNIAAPTPRSAWKAGSFPYLYQTDSQWAQTPYADGTIATHGCGPTCLSIVYIGLTGKTNLDPASMGGFTESHGYLDSGLTSWLLMSEGAEVLGLRSGEVPAGEDAIKRQLSEGHPIICSVHAGDFTTEGHFIVLTGINDDGTIEIRDPNSEERSAQTWDTERVLSQCDNLWAFSI